MLIDVIDKGQFRPAVLFDVSYRIPEVVSKLVGSDQQSARRLIDFFYVNWSR